MNQRFKCGKTDVLRGVYHTKPREMPTSGKKKGPGRIKDNGADSMHSVDDHLNGKSIFNGTEERFHHAPASLRFQQGVEIKKRLDKALQEVDLTDHYLLENNVGERAIAARLAIHLQEHFPKHAVDAEYNRDGERPKRLSGLPEECAHYRNEDGESLAVPDVIVHGRGTRGPNLLVVELKKTTNSDHGECDRLRLRAFREQYGYQFGALILCETRRGYQPKMTISAWLGGEPAKQYEETTRSSHTGRGLRRARPSPVP